MPRSARPSSLLFAALLAGVSLLVGASAPAQPLAPPGFTPSETSAVAPRVFAPGVLEIIPPDLRPEEVTSVHDLIELRSLAKLNWTPKLLADSETLLAKSEGVRFRRDVWQLEFAFKPLRMIFVDLPNPDGTMERRLVWYLVYRVTNRGDGIAPVETESGYYAAEKKPAGPQTFTPHFVLEGHETDAAGNKLYRAYLDKLVPAAIEPIRRRELPGRKLFSSIEMAKQEIPVGADADEQSVWGVATWLDVDPEMDFFSVFVRGLTNAYRWDDPAGAYAAGDTPGKGRRFARKTLQLNFWRPGDQFLEHESEVRFGVAPGKAPLYGVDEGVAYRWIYR